MTEAVERIFDECLPVNARRSGLGSMLDGYMAATLAPMFERRRARDEQLAPIRLLVARRQARVLLRDLVALDVERRRFAEQLRERIRAETARRLTEAFAFTPYQAPPWWSPLPESVTGVLRAWWRRWRAR